MVMYSSLPSRPSIIDDKHYTYLFLCDIYLYENYNAFYSVLVTDNRCYLESGGSAESFFVSEDLSVSSFIGKF